MQGLGKKWHIGRFCQLSVDEVVIGREDGESQD